MSGDLALQMYEVQAQLIEIKEELGKIRKENDELKNQMAVNNLMKTVNDHAKLLESVGAMQVNFNTLSTKVSSSDQILSKINETIRKQNQALEKLNETTEALKTKEKRMADDQTKLSRNVETIQEKVTTLSANVCNNDGTFFKVNESLERQNKDVHVRKKNIKTMEKETILVLGGRSGKGEMDSLLILQDNGENDGNWKQLNIKLPYAVWLHGAQFLNNYLYIFGGTNEKNEVLSLAYKLKRGHRWLNNNLQWEKIKDMNEKRTYISNSSVILNDRIWVISGCNEKNHALKSVEMYNPQTDIWTNMKEMNEKRGLSAAAVVHGKIFCCGGETGGDYSKTTECYDPSSDIWTLISDMPGANGGCGIVVMDAHLIVIGGVANKKDFLSSVWVLDTTDKNAKWIEREPCLSRPLCEFSIAKIDDKIFIFGGLYINERDSDYHVTNTVEIFDGDVWRNGPKLPVYLRDSTAVVIPIEFARSLN